MKRIFTLVFSLFVLSQHQLKAQTLCDSLDIQVAYAPFQDSLIEIRVWNSSTAFFNYPGFIIYDANGDTVAIEQVNLFGISQSSVHALQVYPNAITNPSFNGTLEFYTWNYDSLQCTYPVNFNLCPDTARRAIFHLGNFGGAMFTGDVSYEVKNSGGLVAASGMLTIDADQYDADTMYLLPGDYSMNLSNITLTPGGAKGYGMTTDSATISQLFWTHNATNDTSFSFSFYGKCPNPTSVPHTPVNTAELVATVVNEQLHIKNIAGSILGNVTVYAMDGKKVIQATVSTSYQTFDVAALALGMYVVHAWHGNRSAYKKIIID